MAKGRAQALGLSPIPTVTLVQGPSNFGPRSVLSSWTDASDEPPLSPRKRASIGRALGEIAARAPAGLFPSVTEFRATAPLGPSVMSAVAAWLLRSAFDMDARSRYAFASSPAVVFDTPLASLGRYALFRAQRIWERLATGRRVDWAAEPAEARRWASAVELRALDLVRLAERHDVPLRPLQPPELWELGEGSLARTVSVAAPFDVDALATELAGPGPWRVPFRIAFTGTDPDDLSTRFVRTVLVSLGVPLLKPAAARSDAPPARPGPTPRVALTTVSVEDAASSRGIGYDRAQVTVVRGLGAVGSREESCIRAVVRQTCEDGWIVVSDDDTRARLAADAKGRRFARVSSSSTPGREGSACAMDVTVRRGVVVVRRDGGGWARLVDLRSAFGLAGSVERGLATRAAEACAALLASTPDLVASEKVLAAALVSALGLASPLAPTRYAVYEDDDALVLVYSAAISADDRRIRRAVAELVRRYRPPRCFGSLCITGDEDHAALRERAKLFTHCSVVWMGLPEERREDGPRLARAFREGSGARVRTFTAGDSALREALGGKRPGDLWLIDEAQRDAFVTSNGKPPRLIG